MSPFMIFAVVLTFAYIIYFSVTIMRDLYGKKDGQKDEPETIDVGDITGEDAPVSVSENEDGFHIDGDDGDVPYTEQIHGDGVRVIEPAGYVASQEDDIPQSGRAAMISEQLNEEFAAEADELTPDHEFVATPEEYNIFLQEKHSARSRHASTVRTPLMNCKAIIFLKSAMAGMLLVQSLSATAKCGGVDYSWGADALATAHNDVVTMIFYVFYLIYAVSSIVAVIGVILRFSQFLYCFHNARK